MAQARIGADLRVGANGDGGFNDRAGADGYAIGDNHIVGNYGAGTDRTVCADFCRGGDHRAGVALWCVWFRIGIECTGNVGVGTIWIIGEQQRHLAGRLIGEFWRDDTDARIAATKGVDIFGIVQKAQHVGIGGIERRDVANKLLGVAVRPHLGAGDLRDIPQLYRATITEKSRICHPSNALLVRAAGILAPLQLHFNRRQALIEPLERGFRDIKSVNGDNDLRARYDEVQIKLGR